MKDNVDLAKDISENIQQKTKEINKALCAAIPEVSGAEDVACHLAKIPVILAGFVAFFSLVVTSDILQIAITSLGTTTNIYEKNIYFEEAARDQWMTESMSIINTNMHDQHLAMRSQLQKRHEDILNQVNIYTNCRVDLHGIDMVRDTSGPSSLDILLGGPNGDLCRCLFQPDDDGCSDIIARRRLQLDSGDGKAPKSIRDYLNGNRTQFEKFVDRYGPSVRYAGCDGFDNDKDELIDECDEDQFVPEIALPTSDEVSIVGNNVTLIGKSFKTSDEAILYLKSNIKVVDDCASDQEVMLSVNYVSNTDTAFPGEFEVQPTSTISRPTSLNGDVEDCIQEGVVWTFKVDITGKPTVFCKDNYPPELILPPNDEVEIANGTHVTIKHRSFSTPEEAVAYLSANIRVVDDCAPDVDLTLDVEYTSGTLCPGEFKVAPRHVKADREDEVGITRTFKVDITGKDTVFCIDNYPPELVLPPNAILIEDGGIERIVIQDKIFKDVSEASFFLGSLRVIDDCARDVDLDVNVTYVGGVCEESLFKVTPIHDTGCGLVSGIDRNFAVYIDNAPPLVDCEVYTQGLLGTGSGVFTDLGFSFTAVDGGKKCTATKDLVVSIEVLSNEVVATGEEVSYIT